MADWHSREGREEQVQQLAYGLDTAVTLLWLVCWLDNSELALAHCFQAGNVLWLNYVVGSKAVADVVSRL